MNTTYTAFHQHFGSDVNACSQSRLDRQANQATAQGASLRGCKIVPSVKNIGSTILHTQNKLNIPFSFPLFYVNPFYQPFTFHQDSFQGLNLLAKICEQKNKGAPFCFLPWAPQTLVTGWRQKQVLPRAPKWRGSALLTGGSILSYLILICHCQHQSHK